jgi:hypothetical protein
VITEQASGPVSMASGVTLDGCCDGQMEVARDLPPVSFEDELTRNRMTNLTGDSARLHGRRSRGCRQQVTETNS